MRIKKTTQYAIQILGYIHINNEAIITSNMIAEAEGIPHGVLMKVLRRLAQEEIVVSHQGRGKICGGFSLNKSLKQLTLYDLMQVMGEEMCDKSRLERKSNKQSHRIFSELYRIDSVLSKELKKYSLYDVTADWQEGQVQDKISG